MADENRQVARRAEQGLSTFNEANLAYIEAATSENTRKTYRSAIRQFIAWGGKLPCDEAMLCRYVVEKARELNARTIQLHVTAVRQWHRTQGLSSPTESTRLQKLLKGISRTHAKPKQRAKAISMKHIKLLCGAIETSDNQLKVARDRALLLLGYFAALRRSELVAIRVEDLEWHEEGVVLTLPRSKTDQTGEGMRRAIPANTSEFCAVAALKKWLLLSGVSTGDIFLRINRWQQLGSAAIDPSAVNTILKQAAKQCGFDFVPDISGHSLRRGAATAAAKAGASFDQIKNMGGWRSDNTVWQYIEEGKQFENSAAKVLMDSL